MAADMIPTLAGVAGIVLITILVIVVLFRSMWRVAEPNEALIISGSRHRGEDGSGLGFRIVTGRGTFVIPGLQVVRRLSLDINEAPLAVNCVTKQGIEVGLRGVVIFKVGDDEGSISNSARRFLDQQDQMVAKIVNVFEGHLRSIVGNLTMEELVRERERLTQETAAAAGTEVEKLGLIIDTLQIQNIEDPTGYIVNMSKPYAAEVEKQARIAQAIANQQATEAEAQAQARQAEAIRASRIAQAQYQAEIDQAAAKAAQSGPLAAAAARQEVVVQETEVAKLEASRREQQLDAEVRRPADAARYQVEQEAIGARNATIAEAEAQRAATIPRGWRTRKLVDREGRRRAAPRWPMRPGPKVRHRPRRPRRPGRRRPPRSGRKVSRTPRPSSVGPRPCRRTPRRSSCRRSRRTTHRSSPTPRRLSRASTMQVLNGAEGVTEMLTSIIGQGLAGLNVVRGMLGTEQKTPPRG
jgi:uncharacterized membrane protein YqiK